MEKLNVNPSIEKDGAEEVDPYNFTLVQKKLLVAYEACSCNISETCLKVGVSRNYFYKCYNEIPEFKSQCELIADQELDFAEGQLKFLMKGQYVYRKKKDSEGKDIEGQFEVDAEGNPIRDYINPIDNASVMFKLKTQGKKRGYTYRQEITGADGNAIGGFEINIIRKNKGE